MTPHRAFGFWILLIGGGCLTIIFLLGQTYSLVDYETTVAWGLQEPADKIGITGQAFNFGFAVVDTIFYIPVFSVGLWGVWARKTWGLVAMSAACGISVYWPIMVTAAAYIGQGEPGFGYPSPVTYLPLTLPTLLYALWGLWYLHTRRGALFDIP